MRITTLISIIILCALPGIGAAQSQSRASTMDVYVFPGELTVRMTVAVSRDGSTVTVFGACTDSDL